jgi:protein-tyrosine phosphatase
MTRILPHLYVGTYDDAMNEIELKAKRITHILSLTGNSSPVEFVQHENIPMHDRGKTALKGVIERVSKFMQLVQQEGNGVLIHCNMGQNRSATVVIALLMKNHNHTL